MIDMRTDRHTNSSEKPDCLDNSTIKFGKQKKNSHRRKINKKEQSVVECKYFHA